MLRLPVARMLMLAAGVWVLGATAPAQARQDGSAWSRGQWQAGGEPRRYSVALPPEQRQQMRQQMREHWQQMPPEQRDARRQEFRERWQQMPSDERQRLREEMREQRGGGYDDRRGGRGYRW